MALPRVLTVDSLLMFTGFVIEDLKSIAEVARSHDVESALTALKNRKYDCILYDPFCGGGKFLEDIQKKRCRIDILSDLADYFISSVRKEDTLNQSTTIIAVSYAPLVTISGLSRLFREKRIEAMCLSSPNGYARLKEKILEEIK